MKQDKLKIYLLESVICVILFFALFVSNIFTRTVLAIILTVYTFIVYKSIQKKNIYSIYHRQVILVMFLIAVVYLLIFYAMGLFTGYYESVVKFSLPTLTKFIIPTAVIIIMSEIIRTCFLTLKDNVSKVLTILVMVLIDLIIYTNIYQITTLDGFLHIIGFTFFASISCNLLFTYVSNRYGAKPIIVFRMIMILYTYIIPITPDIYIFFRSFLRIIYPYIIYLILESLYERDTFVVAVKNKKRNYIITVVLMVIMVLIIMLVSCKFKYGILVIGSGSMTGSIDKGDAVLYEAYSNQENLIWVHRVIDVKMINGEYRYYTKGDANENPDAGFVTKEELIGVTNKRIRYIGYPTLWLRDMFK